MDVRVSDFTAVLRMCGAWSIGVFDGVEEFRFDYGGVSIVVSENTDGTLEVRSVYNATIVATNMFGALRLLNRAADAFGVTMLLNVQPYATEWAAKQPRERVARLYQRFGFVSWKGRRFRLVRTPRIVALAQPGLGALERALDAAARV